MFNNTNLVRDGNYSQQLPSRTFTFINGIIMLTTSTMGIIGHLAIVCVIIKQDNLRRHIINIFICSLSINDITNLLFIQSLVLISYLFYSWPFGNVLCFLVPEVSMILVAISLVHHVFIGIHRYLVVVRHSFYVKIHKTRYAVSVIACSRLYPIVLSFLLMSFLSDSFTDLNNIIIYDPRLLRCVYRPKESLRISIIIIFTIIVPCVVVSLCFVLILIFVRRMSFRSNIRDESRIKREIRITKMFALVFVMFIMGYIPYGIVRAADSKKTFPPDVYVVITMLYALASCLNSMIFGLMNECLRKAILKLLFLKG